MKKAIFYLFCIIAGLGALALMIFTGEASGVIIATGAALTIDEQVAAQLKEKLDGLGSQVDAKIKAAGELLQKGLLKAEDMTSIKTEVSDMVTKYNEMNEAYTTRIDLIETKMGRFGEVMARKTLKEALVQKFTDTGVKRGYFGEIGFKEDDFKGVMSRKADDMTMAISTTGDVVRQDFVPEIFFDPDRKQRVRDLVAQGTTQSSTVDFIKETFTTDATTYKVEGAALAQSDLDLVADTAIVQRIGHYIMLSEEMLDDIEGMTSYLMARLPSKVKAKEDVALLYGDGTSTQLDGITVQAAAYTDALADSLITEIDVLVEAIRQVEDDEYMADAILVHPTTYAAIILNKDSTGQYIHPEWVFGNKQVNLSGVPVIKTTAITAGDFLVGDFRSAAQVFDRRELVLEFSKSNEDNFIKGMVTVRCDERITLAVYRPNAFIYGTFVAALANGSA